MICQRTGKQSHGSRSQAHASMASLGFPRGASVYRCRACGGWHWGERKPLPSPTEQRQLSGTYRMRRKLGLALARGDSEGVKRWLARIAEHDAKRRAQAERLVDNPRES